MVSESNIQHIIQIVLENTLSTDKHVLEAAQSFLEQAADANLAEFIKALSEILACRENSPVARMAAGLQLKNHLTSKDAEVKQNYQQRWLTFPLELRSNVKNNILAALGTETIRPSSAAQCLAHMAVAELPVNQWPELIPVLVANVTAVNSTEMDREATLEAIGYICQEINYEVLAAQSKEILTAIAHGMKRKDPSNHVRLAATTALLNSLEFFKSDFDKESERHFIMQAVCEGILPPDTEVRVVALQCLVKIMSLYYHHMENFMGPALTAITLEAMRSDVDNIALQGIEFWCSVCDEEADSAIENINSRLPEHTSKFYAKGALQYLVPVLIQTLTKHEEYDDEDDWNPCKAAGVCLMLLAHCCEDVIVPHVLPFVKENIENPNSWRFRDAAVMAFGSIVEGPNAEHLKPIVEQAMPFLFKLMHDQSVNVRETAAWTIGRVCDVIPDAVIAPTNLRPLLQALVFGLTAEPRVASNVCWAFSSLAEAAYEAASQTTDGNEPETYCLSEFFEPIVKKLLETTDRQDAAQANLRTAAYEALMGMVKNSPKDCYITVKTMNAILRRLQQVLNMEASVRLYSDGIQYNDLLSLLYTTLHSILRKKLLETTNQQDASQANLNDSTAYEEIMKMVEDFNINAEKTSMIILEFLQQVLTMEAHVSSQSDRVLYNDPLSLLCAILHSVLRKNLKDNQSNDVQGPTLLIQSSYKALMEFFKNFPMDCYIIVQKSAMFILERLHQVLKVEAPYSSLSDRFQYNDLLSLLCATLQSILHKMMAEDADKIFDPFMTYPLQKFNLSAGVNDASGDRSTKFPELLLMNCRHKFQGINDILLDIEKKKKKIESKQSALINEVKNLEAELEILESKNPGKSKQKQKKIDGRLREISCRIKDALANKRGFTMEKNQELENLTVKYRELCVRNIMWMGKLFKSGRVSAKYPLEGIVSLKYMRECIVHLLNHSNKEESLEYLCRLLKTIGKDFEIQSSIIIPIPVAREDEHLPAPSAALFNGEERSRAIGGKPSPLSYTFSASMVKPEGLSGLECGDKGQGTMNTFFVSLFAVLQKYLSTKLSDRIRFLIEEVIDLRKNKWKPRLEDGDLETNEQVEQFHLQEEMKRVRDDAHNFQESMRKLGVHTHKLIQRKQDIIPDFSTLALDEVDVKVASLHRPEAPNKYEMAIKVVSVLQKYFTHQSIEVAVHDLKEFLAPASVPHLIAGCMMHALKHNQVERKCIGILLKGMLKQNLIKISDFRDGFFTLLLNVEYTSSSINTCDLAQLTAPIFETDIVDIGFLGSLCDILDSKLAVGFVAYTLKEILNSTEGVAKAEQLWTNSKTSFNHILPGVDVKAFIFKHSELEFVEPGFAFNKIQVQSVEPSGALRGTPTYKVRLISKNTQAILDKIYTNEWLKWTVRDLKKWLHASTVATFIRKILIYKLGHQRMERKRIGMLLKEMLQRNLFTTQQVLQGFTGFLQHAENLHYVLLSRFWKCVAELIEPIFEDGVTNICFLGNLAALLVPSLAPNFVAATLQELHIATGGAAEKLWILSNISFIDILPGINLDVFILQHEELAFLKPKTTSSNPHPTEFQLDLLVQFLRERRRCSVEICDWITNSSCETDSPSFIRALTTAIVAGSIGGEDTDCRLVEYSEVLTHYIKNVNELRLQLLLAVQTLVTQRQYPISLIQGLFKSLFDSNVFSDIGGEALLDSPNPYGKSMALDLISTFRMWQKESNLLLIDVWNPLVCIRRLLRFSPCVDSSISEGEP